MEIDRHKAILSQVAFECELALRRLEDSVTRRAAEFQPSDAKKKVLESRIGMLENQLRELESNLNKLELNIGQDASLKGTLAILKRDFPGLRGVAATLLTYSNEVAPWVEAALGDKMNLLVFNQVSQAEKALEWLRETQQGDAQCLGLDKVPAADTFITLRQQYLVSAVRCPQGMEALKNLLIGKAYISGQRLYHDGVVRAIQQQGANPELTGSRSVFLLREKYLKELARVGCELEASKSELSSLSDPAAESRRRILENMRQKHDRISKAIDLFNRELDRCLTEIEKQAWPAIPEKAGPPIVTEASQSLPVIEPPHIEPPLIEAPATFIAQDSAVQAPPAPQEIIVEPEAPPMETAEPAVQELQPLAPEIEPVPVLAPEPTSAPEPVAIPAIEPPAATPVPELSRPKEITILVVEDESFHQQLAREVLESAGYCVVIAGDGNEGIREAKKREASAIFMDVVMPNKNGWQACRELKSDPQTKDIPIIMLTTKSNPAEEMRSWEGGIDAFCAKPMGLKALETLANVLACKKL